MAQDKTRAERIIEEVLDRVAIRIARIYRMDFNHVRSDIENISEKMHCAKVFKNGKTCGVILCPHHTIPEIRTFPGNYSSEKKDMTNNLVSISDDAVLQSLMEYNINEERRRQGLPSLGRIEAEKDQLPEPDRGL